MMAKPCCTCQFPVTLLAITRDCHQRHCLATRLREEQLSQFIAIYLGQADIEQADIWPIDPRTLQGFVGTVFDHDMVACHFKQHAEHCRSILVVIDDHDSQRIDSLRQSALCVRNFGCFLVIKQTRQADGKSASLAWPIAVTCDRAAMQFNQAFDERQAQAQSACGTVRATLSLREQIKNMGNQFGRHAKSIVTHVQINMFSIDIHAK